MSMLSNTLIITYRSGRQERIKFDSWSEADKSRKKLLTSEAIVSVEFQK